MQNTLQEKLRYGKIYIIDDGSENIWMMKSVKREI